MSRAIAPSHIAMNGYHRGPQSSHACQTFPSTSELPVARSKCFKQVEKYDSLTAQHSSLFAANEHPMDDLQPTGQAPDACKQNLAELSYFRMDGLHVRFF